jgi:hypothetical protein
MLFFMYLGYVLIVGFAVGSVLKRALEKGVPQKPLATVSTLDNLRESQATIENLEANENQSH